MLRRARYAYPRHLPQCCIACKNAILDYEDDFAVWETACIRRRRRRALAVYAQTGAVMLAMLGCALAATRATDPTAPGWVAPVLPAATGAVGAITVIVLFAVLAARPGTAPPCPAVPRTCGDYCPRPSYEP